MDEIEIDLELVKQIKKENKPKKIYTKRVLDIALHLQQKEDLTVKEIALYLERKEGLKINTTYLSHILKKHALKNLEKPVKEQVLVSL